MTKSKTTFNYRRNLVIMLISLQLLTVTSILLLSKINTEKILINNAYESMATTIAQSADQTRAFLKPAHRLIDSLGMLAGNSVLEFDDIVSLEKIFITALTENPSFAGIYIANEQGDFIYMLRVEPTEKNPFSGLQTKSIIHKRDSRSVTFKNRHKDFTAVKEENINDYSYDPRTRRWYKLANQKTGIAWAEPYTFFTSKKLGITASKAFTNIQNNEKGVIGVDIEISELSKFLKNITINDDEYIRITDEWGTFIADSGISTEVPLETVNNLINKQKSDHTKSKKQSGTFELNDSEFLFTQKPLKESSFEPDWNVFTYAKTAPFLAEIRASEIRNVLIALATFLLSILVSIYIASKTSKPVETWITQASTDNLTGLYNRHYFFNTANTLYNKHSKSGKSTLALMLLDADLFKRINDNYGHNIGDEVLKGLADRITSNIPLEMIFARYGGEEFILLGEMDSEKEALHFAETIRSIVSHTPIETTSGEISLTISIGLATTSPSHKLSFIDFIDTADKALYQSKHKGRNTVYLAEK